MYSTNWKALADGFEGNSKYLAELHFLEQASTPIEKGDKLIMLYDVNGIMTSLFNCSHLLYTVHSVIGTKTYARLTESMWTVGPDHAENFFPEKIMMQIPDAYILFEEGPSTTPVQNSLQQPSSQASQLGSQSRDRTIDDDTSSDGIEDHGGAEDSESEDSDSTRTIKTPSIRMGRMNFRVVGKTTIRDGRGGSSGNLVNTFRGVRTYGDSDQHNRRSLSARHGRLRFQRGKSQRAHKAKQGSRPESGMDPA